MRRRSSLTFAFVAALVFTWVGATGCTDPRLQSAEGELSFTPSPLKLGATWQGEVLERKVRVTNRGRSPVTLEWTAPPPPFELIAAPASLGSAGEADLFVRFVAGAPGEARAEVTVKSNAGRRATLPLYAISQAIPPPPTPQACHLAHFDVKLSEYVESAQPDGTSCEAHSVCITDAKCLGGRCTGKPITCDDGNACTLNVCNAKTGCEYPPAPPCPGDGKCQQGSCHPKTGCGFVTAPDGTACGPVQCDAAQVCIAGACVVRDPPDGYVCAEASPCQDEGLCQGNTCVQPPPTTLAPTWSFDSTAAAPDGGSPPHLHDMVMEPTGELSLLGFFEPSHLRKTGTQNVVLPAAPRRCIGWGGGLACADYGASATVASLGFDGLTRWSFNLAIERPDVAAENDNVFMARIASMGSDRLLAVYETYPKDAGQQTLCRGFYLVALNASGKLVWMQKLSEPELSVCQHPHPYGLATDGDGNIYLAFSTSFIDPSQAIPLAAQAPTLFMSFTPNGVKRWTRTENVNGGELAVADGLLYPESAPLPFDAATGTPLVSANKAPRAQMGRAVVTSDRYVTSPTDNGGVTQGELRAYDHKGDLAWTHTLQSGDWFVTRELQLIDWRGKIGRPTNEAVLSFASLAGVNHVRAIKAKDGSHLWSCPLSMPANHYPDTVAVANGSFAIMTGATTCGTCDPPYARSTAAFRKFIADGMTPAESPWPGTFGGPLHDHREKALPAILQPGTTPN